VKKLNKKMNKIKKIIIPLTIITVFLFLTSFFLNETAEIILQIVSIAYLIFFIGLSLIKIKHKIEKQKEEKRTKNFTGSTYRKIFHRKECRFADSIKDQYLIESDDKDFFLKQGYKPCKICMSKNTDKSNLKERK